jgi:hypothetical protein
VFHDAVRGMQGNTCPTHLGVSRTPAGSSCRARLRRSQSSGRFCPRRTPLQSRRYVCMRRIRDLFVFVFVCVDAWIGVLIEHLYICVRAGFKVESVPWKAVILVQV